MGWRLAFRRRCTERLRRGVGPRECGVPAAVSVQGDRGWDPGSQRVPLCSGHQGRTLLPSKRVQPSLLPESAESGPGKRNRGHLLAPCCWELSRADPWGHPTSTARKKRGQKIMPLPPDGRRGGCPAGPKPPPRRGLERHEIPGTNILVPFFSRFFFFFYPLFFIIIILNFSIFFFFSPKREK